MANGEVEFNASRGNSHFRLSSNGHRRHSQWSAPGKHALLYIFAHVNRGGNGSAGISTDSANGSAIGGDGGNARRVGDGGDGGDTNAGGTPGAGGSGGTVAGHHGVAGHQL